MNDSNSALHDTTQVQPSPDWLARGFLTCPVGRRKLWKVMRKALRILTALVAILLTGGLPMRAESCELAPALCRHGSSQLMTCCRGAHCHCDMSAPCQSSSNRMPARNLPTSSHRVARPSIVTAFVLSFAGAVADDRALAPSPTASTPAPIASYLRTHAFLI
jgi:hypothetical protein